MPPWCTHFSEIINRLLKTQQQLIREKFQQLDDIPLDMRQSHLTIEYMHRQVASEIEWLTELINRLQSTEV